MDSLLTTLISTFCIIVSFLLAPCAASDYQVNLPESLQEYGNFAVQHEDKFSLPRKLKLQEEGNIYGDEDVMLDKKLVDASSGNKQKGKQENVVRKGTWREWVETPNNSDYFTMDYAWVRRRRPIHNKQLPFVP